MIHILVYLKMTHIIFVLNIPDRLQRGFIHLSHPVGQLVLQGQFASQSENSRLHWAIHVVSEAHSIIHEVRVASHSLIQDSPNSRSGQF